MGMVLQRKKILVNGQIYHDILFQNPFQKQSAISRTLLGHYYIKAKLANMNQKYHFLIMVGEGERYNGIPLCIRTRLKNKMHRSIFLALNYYKDGKGVVSQCYYYDRKYKRQDFKITPPQLISCFFPYSQEGILDLLNNEICCDFTHMIVTEGIDIDSDTTPLCGTL